MNLMVRLSKLWIVVRFQSGRIHEIDSMNSSLVLCLSVCWRFYHLFPKMKTTNSAKAIRESHPWYQGRRIKIAKPLRVGDFDASPV